MNRSNLEKLATYLEGLPSGYQGFDMKDYHKVLDLPSQVLEAPVTYDGTRCGSVACAVGHGPVAGIEALPCESWREYAFRAFFDMAPSEANEWGSYPPRADKLWTWAFSGDWQPIDNTPQGAAKRIRYMLANEQALLEAGSFDWKNFLGDFKYMKYDVGLAAAKAAAQQLLDIYKDY